MKKLLSIILPEVDAGETENTPEQVEILSFCDDKTLADALKKAKGKFTLVAHDDVECDVTEDFFKEIDETNADIIKYRTGFLIKTAQLKSVAAKVCNPLYVDLSAVFLCKNIFVSKENPFTFKTAGRAFSKDDGDALSTALDEFTKCKAKLVKDIYSFAFDEICERIIGFIALGLVAVREGDVNAEVMAEFDAKLKKNIVLYLAVEKRFTFANLKKVRENGYKTGFFAYKKMKKAYC